VCDSNGDCTMKTQEDFLKEILQLVKANPEMEVHFCVDSGELVNMPWTKHKISRVVIQPFFERDETIYVSEDEIKRKLKGNQENSCSCGLCYSSCARIAVQKQSQCRTSSVGKRMPNYVRRRMCSFASLGDRSRRLSALYNVQGTVRYT
jgi:hypothetical protein